MTWASPHPGIGAVAAVGPSDVMIALLVAAGVWLLGWGLLLAFSKPRRPIVALRSAFRASPETATIDGPRAPQDPADAEPAPELTGAAETGDIPGVLRWLLTETEADAAAYLRLAPGGAERLVVEPRGLEPELVAGIARTAREALVRPSDSTPSGFTIARWLGAGGSKVIVLRGVSGANEPLRFARFAIEWVGAARSLPDAQVVEDRVRGVPGVAWAELVTEEEPGPTLRVLLADGVDRRAVKDEIEALADRSAVEVEWIDPSERREAPRARLVDVVIELGDRCTAEVYLDWRGRELRGRGQAAVSPTATQRAAANAVADALRPLLAGDILVEGLYAHPHHGGELLVVVVSVEGEPLVGAVRQQPANADTTAARAVLDAVNRRLALVAGGSGRI